MLILKTVALWTLITGIGGIAGAIETGTSPVNAAVSFLTGCLLAAVCSKLGNW
ncbi:hypothetical protein IMSAG249_01773 [Lachnospiraceae bacterium]|nr:hypothetical protein IMSAG249_01773 [Lachnospiraceae bacterium]